MQQGSPFSYVCVHISNAPDVRIIMRLQYVRVRIAINAPALLITRMAPLQCRETRQHGTTLLAEGGVVGR
jgi:hypothetical protein